MIIVIRRLQYSDERDDYNQMDTSRLIEEEAQYNAWSSWSLSWPFWPPASWPAWPPASWPSWPPWPGWSRYVCVARGKKAVCKTRRHSPISPNAQKIAICDFCKILQIWCQIWEPIESKCASKRLTPVPFFTQKLSIPIRMMPCSALQLSETSYTLLVINEKCQNDLGINICWTWIDTSSWQKLWFVNV